MKRQRKLNILMTLSPIVVERLNSEAERLQLPRSVIVELLLRRYFGLELKTGVEDEQNR